MAVLGRTAIEFDGYSPDGESSSSEEETTSFDILKPDFEVTAPQFFQELHEGISRDLALKLASLGFFASPDGSCAFSHESTTSPAYTRFSDDERLIKGRNMDSGAATRRFRHRTNAACIADGISGNGLASAFAAHLFCLLLIHEIGSTPVCFSTNREANTKITIELFKKIAKKAASNMPYGAYRKHGAAPIGFVDCTPLADPNRYGVAVGALGDVVIYHYATSEKRVRQINKITRNLGPDEKPLISDTGGYIATDGNVYCPERLSADYIEIAKEDFLILSTDGLHDNLCSEDAEKIVEFIIQNDFFDQSLDLLTAYPRPWETKKPRALPTLGELADFATPYTQKVRLTASIITQRIIKYIKVVNHTGFVFDEKYYALCLQHKKLPVEKGKERAALTAKLLQLTADNPHAPGKPDDCMVITIRPSNSEGA